MRAQGHPMPLPASLAPLRRPTYRAVWIANVLAGLGTWMQNTGAGWLMTDLSPEPLLVALVQVASLAPALLLALPAGALADRMDRRRYLIATQTWMLLVSSGLAVLAVTGEIGPWTLLLFTAAIGAGNAMSNPAWQAIAPELVPREELSQAIALHGMGFNGARAIGPAIAGQVLNVAGAWACFALNAISYLPMIVAFATWKRAPDPPPGGREGLIAAIRGGLRYVRATPPYRRLMARAFLHFLFAAAPMALLPLIVRQGLGQGPATFGVLLGAMGFGAVAGGLVQPWLRARLDPDRRVALCGLVTACAMLVLALVPVVAAATLAMAAYGATWIVSIATMQVAAQLTLPNWVRARALSIYQMAFFGGLSFGSFAWGAVGEQAGLRSALLGASAGAGLVALLSRRLALPLVEGATPAPPPSAALLPEPDPDADPERGPLVVLRRYRVEAGSVAGFLAAMDEVEGCRRRDGAIAWQLLERLGQPDAWLEVFTFESLAEYRRHLVRITGDEALVLAEAERFHAGPAPPATELCLGATRHSG